MIFVDTPTGSGCCNSPTQFDMRRRKLYSWFLGVTMNTYKYGFIQSRLGSDTTNKFNNLTDLLHLINWMLMIRKKMECEGKCWDEYISEEQIKCIIARFHCLGIDVNCVFIDLEIYFKPC